MFYIKNYPVFLVYKFRIWCRVWTHTIHLSLVVFVRFVHVGDIKPRVAPFGEFLKPVTDTDQRYKGNKGFFQGFVVSEIPQ